MAPALHRLIHIHGHERQRPPQLIEENHEQVSADQHAILFMIVSRVIAGTVTGGKIGLHAADLEQVAFRVDG